MNTFNPADVLLPKTEDFAHWSVIACDQFTSQPEYWERVDRLVGPERSALRLILPEAWLGRDDDELIRSVHEKMRDYLEDDFFKTYPRSYVYVERTLLDGIVRRGLVGAIDLERYDYSDNASEDVRTTEKTVPSRIPPRKKIRCGAQLDLPHVLLLFDDAEDTVFKHLETMKGRLPLLYDFDLMEGGGRIVGRLVSGENAQQVDRLITEYEGASGTRYRNAKGSPFNYAVGDGNHSLAAAKACYEDLRGALGDKALESPARYAMVELVNIHDPAIVIEPIHRLLNETDIAVLLDELRKIAPSEGGFPIRWVSGAGSGVTFVDVSDGELPTAVLQAFLDRYLASHRGSIDYIHGEDVLESLAGREESIGFIMPPIEKSALFEGIVQGGVLPRKTFSMGHAREKRYYLEARKIV